VDPLVRKGLQPRRLASGAVAGVVIAVISILMLGSEEGPRIVSYVGVTLAVVLTVPWILSVLYLRTGRGRSARDEYLARRRDELGRWGEETLARPGQTQGGDRSHSK
jgi:uncharacterized membrane protein